MCLFLPAVCRSLSFKFVQHLQHLATAGSISILIAPNHKSTHPETHLYFKGKDSTLLDAPPPNN